MNFHNTSYLSGDQILRRLLCGETTIHWSLQLFFFFKSVHNIFISCASNIHDWWTPFLSHVHVIVIMWPLTLCGIGKQGFWHWKTTPLCLLLAWTPYLLCSWAVWACSLLLGSNKRIICTPPYLSEGAVMSLVGSSLSFVFFPPF